MTMDTVLKNAPAQLPLIPDQRTQSRSSLTTERNASTRGEHHQMLIAGQRFHRSYALQANDGRAMRAEEDRGVEACFEHRHTLAHETRLASRQMKPHVIRVRLDPVDLGRWHDDRTIPLTDNESREIRRGTFRLGLRFLRVELLDKRSRLADALIRAFDSKTQAVERERLEHVIECSCIERTEGVLIVRGDEDDRWWDVLWLERFEQAEPVELRHGDVDEDHVRWLFPQHALRVTGVGARRDDRDAEGREVRRKAFARGLLVV